VNLVIVHPEDDLAQSTTICISQEEDAPAHRSVFDLCN
jgi:hypothetical protein